MDQAIMERLLAEAAATQVGGGDTPPGEDDDWDTLTQDPETMMMDEPGSAAVGALGSQAQPLA